LAAQTSKSPMNVGIKATFEICYAAEVDAFIKRKEFYQANKAKAYALILSQCTKPLLHKLATRNDWKDISNDPFKLLSAIEEHSLSYQAIILIRNLF
jgi:hypothetical protein